MKLFGKDIVCISFNDLVISIDENAESVLNNTIFKEIDKKVCINKSYYLNFISLIKKKCFKKKFVTYNNLSYQSLFNALFYAKKRLKKSFLCKKYVIVAIPPDFSDIDKKHLLNIIPTCFINCDMYFIDKIFVNSLAINGKNAKANVFFISRRRSFSATFFFGELFNVNELVEYSKIDKEYILGLVKDKKKSRAGLPENIKQLEKLNNPEYLEAIKLWENDYLDNCYIIYDTDSDIFGFSLNDKIKIIYPMSNNTMIGLNMFANDFKKYL